MCMAVLTACSFTALSQTDEHVFYVSPSGNDRWSGTLSDASVDGADGPFKTLHAAAQALRQLKEPRAGALSQPVTVYLRGGVHYLSEPLRLTPDASGTADCPVTFASYPGERAVVSGGVPIEGWRPEGNSLWAAELPSHFRGGAPPRILRVDDDWATRAREPNFVPDNPRLGGWHFARQTVTPKEGGLFGTGVSNVGAVGDRIEWDVDVSAAGKYTLWLYYGHAHKESYDYTMDGRTVFGVVDGPATPVADVPYTGMAGHVNTRWGRAATLQLEAGPQTIYWQNFRGGDMFLDAFVLCDDPDWNPAQSVHVDSTGQHSINASQTAKRIVLVQAETCARTSSDKIIVGAHNPIVVNDRVIMDAEAFPQWGSWEGAELHIFPAWGWTSTILPIVGVDPERAGLLVECPLEVRAGNRFFIAGTREALDTPGEWCVDGNKILYIPDCEEFTKKTAVAAALETLVLLEGAADAFVEHITFRDLTFMDTVYTLGHTYKPADAAVRFSGARNCIVKECTFTLLGGYAVLMEQRSCANAILRNSIKKLGQGGVLLEGEAATQPHDNLIAANTITDIGLVYKHVGGVYLTTGSRNRIAHNRIERTSRYGISAKSYNLSAYSHNNIIEFNELIDTNLETCDTGAIETLGRDQRDTGNIIRHNLIRNVVGLNTDAKGEFMTPYFTWGIYLDDYSSGTTVYGNIVDGTVLGGFCIHGGKNNHIENNIFLNASSQQLRLQPRDDFMAGNTFKRNVVAYRDPETPLWYSYTRTWRPDRLRECDYNVYWCYGDPSLAISDHVITPEGSYQDWLKTGHDQHSVVADPLFEGLTTASYALAPASPAWDLGFEPIPVERIGPQGYPSD